LRILLINTLQPYVEFDIVAPLRCSGVDSFHKRSKG
jgi:hypothetical protein